MTSLFQSSQKEAYVTSQGVASVSEGGTTTSEREDDVNNSQDVLCYYEGKKIQGGSIHWSCSGAQSFLWASLVR